MKDAGAARDETPSFEAALKQLEEIVGKLEQGELALEESLALYEEGIRLSRLCHAKLEEAEGRIAVLLKDAKGAPVIGKDGSPKTAPFGGSDDDGPF